MVPLSWYVTLAAILFVIGLFGVLSRRNLVAMMMSIELMLNAVNLNLLVWARHLEEGAVHGQVFALMIFAVAAAEAALGLALVLAIWRLRQKSNVDSVDLLKG